MKTKILACFLLVYTLADWEGSPSLLAQEAQIDQSRPFRSTTEPRELLKESEEEEDFFSTSPSTPGDSDLGDQVLLYEEPPYDPFQIGARFTIIHTNNVLLSDLNPDDDRYAVYEGFFNFTPRITSRLYGNIGYSHQFYHYQERGNLNFDSQTVTAGLSAPMPELWNILLYANYSYNRLTYAKGNPDGDALTEFYRSHAATAGILKSIPFSRAHYLYFGPSGRWALTDPFTVARDEYSFLFGYDVDFTRWLNANLAHTTNFFDYKSNDRDDINQVLTGTVTVSPWSWLDVSVFSSYGTNNSTNEALNYEFFNIGGRVQASYEF